VGCTLQGARRTERPREELVAPAEYGRSRRRLAQAVDELTEIRPYVDHIAVVAGAMSGALHGHGRGFDFAGVVVIGIAAGLGGGLLRDALMGQGPALALQSPSLLAAAFAASMLGVLFGTFVTHLGRPLWVVDALSLGLFAVAGVQRAEMAGLHVVPCLFLGVVTCVGGGLVRDLLCLETPSVLLPGQPYSVTALLAGIVYLSAVRGFSLTARTAELLAAGAAFALRGIAAWRGWSVPRPPDLPRVIRQRRQRPRERR
jgi:uncharacterized membrane protein YeiH